MQWGVQPPPQWDDQLHKPELDWRPLQAHRLLGTRGMRPFFPPNTPPQSIGFVHTTNLASPSRMSPNPKGLDHTVNKLDNQ